jgi:hypothetical protein
MVLVLQAVTGERRGVEYSQVMAACSLYLALIVSAPLVYCAWFNPKRRLRAILGGARFLRSLSDVPIAVERIVPLGETISPGGESKARFWGHCEDSDGARRRCPHRGERFGDPIDAEQRSGRRLRIALQDAGGRTRLLAAFIHSECRSIRLGSRPSDRRDNEKKRPRF